MKRLSSLVLLLLSVSLLTACNNVDDNIVQSGFNYENIGDKTEQEIFCAYRSEVMDFEMNDVTLKFYIGIPEHAFGNNLNYSSIAIYAKHYYGNEKVIILTITDFETTSFLYEKVDNSDGTFTINYSFTVDVTIPNNIFISPTNPIELGIDVFVINENGENSLAFGTASILNYSVNETTIELLQEN